MNYGYKGFRQAFTYSQKNLNFSGRFYKNLFKNKSAINLLNSNLNKGKALINFSNKFYMQKAILVLKNISCANRSIGSNETLLNGEENVTDIESFENENLKSFVNMEFLDNLVYCIVNRNVICY
jgi:hypothetical protein